MLRGKIPKVFQDLNFRSTLTKVFFMLECVTQSLKPLNTQRGEKHGCGLARGEAVGYLT